ncbi:hypothetical protein [Vibrio natriegens]|uniref:hypothetical protein n=1 Tax=Vibrio natriegens TaxID=691 RepID=UPI0012DB2BC8|nr:hypothetical protein [Vibrio natriegens]
MTQLLSQLISTKGHKIHSVEGDESTKIIDVYCRKDRRFKEQINQGCPEGLASSSVSKQVKLVSLCDAFEAMTSQRPYRDPMSKQSIKHP